MIRHTLISMMLLVGLFAVGGCLKKKVQLSFTNFTDREMEVIIHGPGEGVGMIGAMSGLGGRTSTELVLRRSELPAHFAWNAGEYNGQFTIVRKSPDTMNIDVGTKK